MIKVISVIGLLMAVSVVFAANYTVPVRMETRSIIGLTGLHDLVLNGNLPQHGHLNTCIYTNNSTQAFKLSVTDSNESACTKAYGEGSFCMYNEKADHPTMHFYLHYSPLNNGALSSLSETLTDAENVIAHTMQQPNVIDCSELPGGANAQFDVEVPAGQTLSSGPYSTTITVHIAAVN